MERAMNRCLLLLAVAAFSAAALVGPPAWAQTKPARPVLSVDQPIRVPFQLTNTKHVLVRVKLNHHAPFNFILDTGAPALFITENVAKKAGIAKNDKGLSKIETMEIEGGVVLNELSCRVEEPFQIVGMNKMNIAGARLDGFMGYSVLAQFRITYDFTDSHLHWKRLDWKPPEVFAMQFKGGKMPADMAAMSGLSQFAAALIGKRPDPVLTYRGLVGMELAEKNGAVVVTKVMKDSPAEAAGLLPGDVLTRWRDDEVESLENLQRLAAKHQAGAKAQIVIHRNGREKTLELELVEGL
jgi:hypothetical protein